ncbi:2-dehydro-3-deoxygluconokinase [Pseudarthrobacter defluvii]|uniref:sugar kinase n=1 Tax=Pseudarthrobacter defluvii TaxID=410837 RepID=UPI002789586E|nr:sugar kinase [Pseudarthrobacter defluvii]MDQ0770972.1 2-dehydro-3-deoxygluconokinase [Pseudarthrobacter defluvii]
MTVDTGPGPDGDNPAAHPVGLLTFGESMVSLRSTGPLANGGILNMQVAGAESNVAIGVARLGHTSAWAGSVGADPHGEFIVKQLRGEGVRLHHSVHPERSTGVMFLEQRTADLSRAFYYRAGSAGATISRDDVAAALDEGARILHLSGITPALSAEAREAVEYAAARAASEGVVVSLDVNYRSKLWSRDEAREVLGPLARHATIVIASDDELDLIAPPGAGSGAAGESDSAAVGDEASAGGEACAAARLLDAGVREVVVKRGAAGAAVYTSEGVMEAAAIAVTCVDTVGAGDAFTAGYLSALLDGADIAARLHRGILAGAFAVSTRGDWEGLPRPDELALLDAARGSTLR